MSHFNSLEILEAFADAQMDQSPFTIVSEASGLSYSNGERVLTEWTYSDDEAPSEPVATEEQARASRKYVDALDEVTKLDDRLAKGLVIINTVAEEMKAALATYIDNKEKFQGLMARLNLHKDRWNELSSEQKNCHRARWTAWQAVLWTKANPAREARNEAYTLYQSRKQKLNKCWDLWKSIRDKKNALAQQYNLWGTFFTLKNFEFNPYWCNPDPKDVTDLLDDTVTAYERMQMMDDKEFEHEHNDEMFVDWNYQDSRKAVRLWIDGMGETEQKELLASRPF